MTKPTLFALQTLDDFHLEAIFQLMQKANITGLPPTFLHAKDVLSRSFNVGRIEDGELKAVFIAAPTEDGGTVYMQAIDADGDPKAEELKRAIRLLMDARKDAEALWTQVARTRLKPYLMAGFVPATPLQVSMPVLCVTRTLLHTIK
jgi:hypothetical protein